MGDIPCIGRPFIQSEYNKWVKFDYNKLKNTNYERIKHRTKNPKI